MNQEFEQRQAFAHRLADEAGRVIRPFFRKRIAVTDKGAAGFFDPVTEADRRAEETVRKLIAENFPRDAILGEEWGEIAGTSGFRWVIDPIDGTRAFISGQPLWGTLIGLEKDGAPVLGLLDQCFLHERFEGASGQTRLIDTDGTRPLSVRACAALGEAVICTTHPVAHFHEDERALFSRLERSCRLSRYGGDCYAYGLLAMGFVDVVMEARLAHWDIAPLLPIIEGAGGVLTDWQGHPWKAGGNVLASGDARLHEQALQILNA